MAVRNPTRIRALHHGAVPVADLGRAYRFYAQVLDARLERLLNATAQALQRGLPESALLELEVGVQLGLALQYEPIPRSTGTEGTVWGLRASPSRVGEITAALQQRNVPTAAPPLLPPGSAFDTAVAFQDPDANVWVLCRGSDGDPVTLSFANVEATDLAAAEAFYGRVLGLTCEARSADWLAFSVGDRGQWLIARQVARLSPRMNLIKGPHVALEVEAAAFDQLCGALPRREQYWERETDKLPWQEPWTQIAYFYDPFYNRLALIVP